MYAHRQIYDHVQESVPVPEKLRNQRVEVIFMALDEEPVVNTAYSLAQALAHSASADIDFDPTRTDMRLQQVEF